MLSASSPPYDIRGSPGTVTIYYKVSDVTYPGHVGLSVLTCLLTHFSSHWLGSFVLAGLLPKETDSQFQPWGCTKGICLGCWEEFLGGYFLQGGVSCSWERVGRCAASLKVATHCQTTVPPFQATSLFSLKRPISVCSRPPPFKISLSPYRVMY